MGITKERNSYRVRVTVNGERKNVGSFPTQKEAQTAQRDFLVEQYNQDQKKGVKSFFSSIIRRRR